MKSLFLPSFGLAGLIALLLAGCASPSKLAHTESLLAASGFQVMPATTPKQLEMLKTLPPGKATKVNRDGKVFFIFPDSNQKQLYIGTVDQYRDYKTRLEIERAAAAENRALEESLEEARTDSAAEWNNAWGPWTGAARY